MQDQIPYLPSKQGAAISLFYTFTFADGAKIQGNMACMRSLQCTRCVIMMFRFGNIPSMKEASSSVQPSPDGQAIEAGRTRRSFDVDK